MYQDQRWPGARPAEFNPQAIGNQAFLRTLLVLDVHFGFISTTSGTELHRRPYLRAAFVRTSICLRSCRPSTCGASLDTLKSQVERNLPNTVGTVPKNILRRFRCNYNSGKRLLAWHLAHLSKAETWHGTCISTRGLV